MISSLLIANRGEIACRIIQTCNRLGIRTIAVYSDADADARHVREADEAVNIGPAPAAESYLVGERIIDAAIESGAEAIHPGYGFLSENTGFARAVLEAGLVWVGPKPETIEAMGLKDEAKRLAEAAGVPVLQGYRGEDQSLETLKRAALDLGFPLLIKAIAGGGGRGIREVNAPEEIEAQLESAQREAASAFGDTRVMLERLVQNPRHIEVQVFGDTQGNVVHLFERDCSLQRRRQKVIEEAPAPGMTDNVREAMTAAAVKLARAVSYEGAGTVEFIVDGSGPPRVDGFWFLEMNTRLQVEHPVTEMITGLDLVEWQLRVASGEALPDTQDEIEMVGHAMEARVCAEDPANGFRPEIGGLELFEVGIPGDEDDDLDEPVFRLDSAVEPGDEIGPFYDSMIAKAIVYADTREAAIDGLIENLSVSQVWPLKTNIEYLAKLIDLPEFRAGEMTTALAGEFSTDFADASRAFEPYACAFGAAGLGVLIGDEGEDSDPWSIPDGWRPNADARLNFVFERDDEPFPVTLTGDMATWTQATCGPADRRETFPLGDLTLHAFEENGEVVLSGQVGDYMLAGTVRPVEGGAAAFIEGRSVSLIAHNPERAAEALEAGDETVAPMPGKLISVLVSVGDAVEKDQPVAVMEAMKMEHTLVAPRSGIVGELGRKSGDQVADGDLILRLEAGTA